jgi:type III pantothenate kinase
MSKSRNLTLDIGNTCSKVLVFEKDAVIMRKVYKSLDMKLVREILNKYKPLHSIICSVTKTPQALIQFLDRNTGLIELNSKTKLPIKIAYKTPETLGTDRLAGIVAASKLFPEKNVLVIDMGTCIKYDFINEGKQYMGGSISPGLHMRLKALHEYTGKLPLVKAEPFEGLIGRTTKGSILTGVQIGILAELEGFISRYKKSHTRLKVILTGGDASGFDEQLKIPIFAAPDLVSIGLNEIINFNAKSN